MIEVQVQVQTADLHIDARSPVHTYTGLRRAIAVDEKLRRCHRTTRRVGERIRCTDAQPPLFTPHPSLPLIAVINIV